MEYRMEGYSFLNPSMASLTYSMHECHIAIVIPINLEDIHNQSFWFDSSIATPTATQIRLVIPNKIVAKCAISGL